VDKAFLSVKVSIPFLSVYMRLHADNGRSAAHHPIHTATCAFLVNQLNGYLNLGFREAALERKVNYILAKLRGTKKLDLFEPARVIHGVPLEQSTRIMARFIAQGKFSHIGLSEARADQIRQAHRVISHPLHCVSAIDNASQGHPITAVEIEISPWSYSQETKDGS
jgi:aryl-alcohol dehydrogenase-like predicted oxidoreductase